MKEKPPAKKNPEILINIKTVCRAVSFNRKKIVKMIRETTKKFGVRKAQINFLVLNDKKMIDLNRKFLAKTDTTDVISFDLSDSTAKSRNFDIAVNAELARRQAKKRGCKPEAELALYCLHGLLHNLGFDDSTTRKARKMHRMEDTILEKFGYGTVYEPQPHQ